MTRRSANFTPPARRPEQSPAVTLFVEPEDPIRVMGEMIRDVDLISEKLRGLAFADDAYRGDLRVIMGVAVRTKRRCERLLGEGSTAADIEGAVGRLAEKIVEQVDEGFGFENGPDAVPPPTPKPLKNQRAGRVRNLGGPAAVPVPGGVKASILKHLARGHDLFDADRVARRGTGRNARR